MTLSMMTWALLATPLLMMAVLIILERVENSVVMPVDRAAKIERLVASSPPDEVERRVAEMLQHVTPPRATASRT